MRLISGILQIIGILVVAAFGYWVYYANWASNPNDKIGIAVANWLPAPVKNWGCGRINQRFATEAPAICAVADPAKPPSDQPSSSDQKPAAPSGEGDGKL